MTLLRKYDSRVETGRPVTTLQSALLSAEHAPSTVTLHVLRAVTGTQRARSWGLRDALLRLDASDAQIAAEVLPT